MPDFAGNERTLRNGSSGAAALVRRKLDPAIAQLLMSESVACRVAAAIAAGRQCHGPQWSGTLRRFVWNQDKTGAR